jgi:hypothetical protein
MADPDIYSLFMDEEPTARAQAQAMSDALRKRKETAGAYRALGMLSSHGQNNLLEGLAKSSMQTADDISRDAGAERGILGQAGQVRSGQALQRAMEAQRQKNRGEDMDIDKARYAEQARHNRAMEGRGNTGAGEPQAKKLAQIPAGEAASLGQYDAATQTLDDLGGEWDDKTGEFSGVMQYLPGTTAARYTDAQRGAAQTVGTVMEEGKLTDADLQKYMDLTPTAGDGKERKTEKITRLKKMLEDKKRTKIEGFRQSGFDVSGYDRSTAPTVAGKKIKVTNGKETLSIDPADLAEAEADGFRSL